MTRAFRSLEDALSHRTGDIAVVSTDVFDTLLLRRPISERSRSVIGATRFARVLARNGLTIPPSVLLEAGTQARRWAFRAREAGGERQGEVRMCDLLDRQLALLGIPATCASERMRIELEIEKECLVANRPLARVLRAWRAAGRRVVAVSDTTLPGEAVRELIEHFHGSDLIDRVYSSADHQATKRGGALFDVVVREEGVPPSAMLHVGDDERADRTMAMHAGLSAVHLPRSRRHRYRRLADGAMRTVRTRPSRPRLPDGPRSASARDFGREVFGPIVTQFCLRIWLYAREAERLEPCRLLFCARGGIGIREAFERVLERLDLPLQAARRTLFVSRLVAARTAIASGRASAFEEIGREFRGDTVRAAAVALGGRDVPLPPEWDRPFDPETFRHLLLSAAGQAVMAEIRRQNALFERHLDAVSDGCRRLVLCDTGLYGSTQRLLSDGLSSRRFETLQFARANYKGYSEEHFPMVSGLLVERQVYSSWETPSCVLRYWHLIETLFEPKLASVRTFHANEDGSVGANSGAVEHGAIAEDVLGEMLRGALGYIDALPPNGGAVALADAGNAWRRLHQAICRPGEAELRLLDVGVRSVDFGRSGSVMAVGAQTPDRTLAKFRSLKGQLWREGAVVRTFPRLKHALLPAVDGFHLLRSLRVALRRNRPAPHSPGRSSVREEGPGGEGGPAAARGTIAV